MGRFRRRALTRKRRLPVTDGRALRAELNAVATRLERILALYGQGKLDEESPAALNRRLRRHQETIQQQLATTRFCLVSPRGFDVESTWTFTRTLALEA